ncbi:sulfurtransferase [Deinococcus sp. SL84]|uniref:sulfurtransferase n=1 Tax=Deinococcus sp. SL84 TaxID=2994663 RepID=UPI0022738A90|nr:sulfurtransferase [Deinococcus sp. SL84]MCY1701648.1 sulfurtransferase [Deinococcus sp. SL84]
MTQSDLPTPLVSAEWLQAHLHDPRLRLLDCRFDLRDALLGRMAYLESHLPGAVYADLEMNLSGPVSESGAGGRHPLPEPEALAAWLGEQGTGNDSWVVCYDAGGAQGYYAARAWWLLRWLGHRQVAVLDGGLTAWQAAGGELTDAEPQHSPATFTPQVQPGFVASADDVAALPAGTLLIDSRAPERYRGDIEPLDRKAGHIPGAVNRNWLGALDESGRFRNAEAQAERLGAGDGQPTVTYCGSGVSATPNLLARELAGVPLGLDNRLYAGSWSDWVSDEGRPTATGNTDTAE